MLNTFFDRIYVISLKSAVDRRRLMAGQLDKLGVDFVFEDAVWLGDINREELRDKRLWAYPGNNFCAGTCSCGGLGHVLSDFEIALHLGHYNVWKDIVLSGYERCLILEDDCIFTEDFSRFSSLDIPDDWQLLYLGHSEKINNFNSVEFNSSFKRLVGGINATHIYAVTCESAKVLVEHTFPIRAAVDGFLAHFMVVNKVLSNVYICRLNLGLNGSPRGDFQSILSEWS